MSYPERIVPGEAERGVDAYHLKRYEFAERWCSGREVLDAACGVGYGTAHLAATARSVVGVDLSDEAIGYARSHYDAANVFFTVMDVLELEAPERSFDVVCSFETIEHVTDPERAVAEFARVLREDGALLISTPQVPETTTSPENPFHRIEFAREDFEHLLRQHFRRVELYGQRRLQTPAHRLVQRLDVLGLRKRFTFARRASFLLRTTPAAELTSSDVVIEQAGVERASELVAVCTVPRRTT